MVSESSDTEDHELPVPPKRQCIQILNMEESGEENRYLNDGEKIRKYHEYQIDKHCYMGTVDNTINRVMETYILTPSLELSQLRLFREAEMEDRAVMMAIQNHGLQMDSGSHLKSDIPEIDLINQNSKQPELPQESNDYNSENIATSSKISQMPIFHNIEEKVKLDIGKGDDGDEHDILERAVAEAIKIKGLSALSVDYG